MNELPQGEAPTGEDRRITSERVYSGRVISVDRDRVRFPDQSTGELEIIRHPGASAIIPVLSRQDVNDPEILMIQQYRYAAGGVIWEIPAGVLEPDELPADCARRELQEESGFSATEVEHLITIFTTPGFTDEQIHLFAGYDLTKRVPDTDPDEFIQVTPVRFSAALRGIRRGEIVDAKTIVALLYFAGHLSRW